MSYTTPPSKTVTTSTPSGNASNVITSISSLLSSVMPSVATMVSAKYGISPTTTTASPQIITVPSVDTGVTTSSSGTDIMPIVAIGGIALLGLGLLVALKK